MWWKNYWKWPMCHKNNWHTLDCAFKNLVTCPFIVVFKWSDAEIAGHSDWRKIWNITAYFIIWTGIIFQILDVDLLACSKRFQHLCNCVFTGINLGSHNDCDFVTYFLTMAHKFPPNLPTAWYRPFDNWDHLVRYKCLCLTPVLHHYSVSTSDPGSTVVGGVQDPLSDSVPTASEKALQFIENLSMSSSPYVIYHRFSTFATVLYHRSDKGC